MSMEEQPEVSKQNLRITNKKNKEGQTVIQSEHQLGYYKGSHKFTEIILSPSINTQTFQGNGGEFSFILEPNPEPVITQLFEPAVCLDLTTIKSGLTPRP